MATEITVAQELGAKVPQFEAALAGTGISPAIRAYCDDGAQHKP